MSSWFLRLVVISSVFVAGAIAPASAQFQWPTNLPPPAGVEDKPSAAPALPSTEAPPAPPAAATKKPPVPTGPDVTGTWKGELTQVGEKAPYKVEIAIAADKAESQYPELKCTGKLIRIGASKSYVFFIEVISKGSANKGGRCPDGTITMARSGEKLVLEWFGDIKGDVVVAYGTLSKEPAAVAGN